MLENAGLITIEKGYAGKRARTWITITKAGRAAFAEELTSAVIGLVGKYHDDAVQSGRKFRVVVAVHPAPDSRLANGTEDKES